jgi:hypothetical protein
VQLGVFGIAKRDASAGPRGRLAEDGTIPIKYNLQENDSQEYIIRTEANVLNSDATLVLSYGPPTGRTAATIESNRKHNKSCHVWLV